MTSLREFFSLPMDAGPNSRFTGEIDEFGRPIQQGALGTQYTMREAEPLSFQEEASAFIQGAREQPRETVVNVARALAEGAWNGVSAPGRALQGETLTYGDVADTALDWGVMSAVGRAPQGALRSGAMLDDAAETPAQTVSRLLREGRASEVTDDLMAQVDPQEMARLYEGGATGMDMPLDEASRLARAREMGFDTDTPLYHGTDRDFPAFSLDEAGARSGTSRERASFLSPSPQVASDYAEMAGQSTSVIPALGPERRFPADFGGYYYTNENMERALQAAHRTGADALETRNLREAFGPLEMHNTPQIAVFDPSNIRSRFARFDPRLSHLANLSAGIGAGAVMLPMLDERETEMQALRDYVERVQ